MSHCPNCKLNKSEEFCNCYVNYVGEQGYEHHFCCGVE